MKINIVEMIFKKGELIFAKEFYTEDENFYKEYYFHNGENISIRTIRGVRLLVDDIGQEYLEWMKKEI